MAETTPGYEAALAAALVQANAISLNRTDPDHQEIPMDSPLHGVRVDPDGTITDITVPSLAGLRAHMASVLGTFPGFAHYGTRESAVTAVVDENSAINGSPRNVPATRFIGTLRDAMPSYWLYGAVCFFGFHIRQGTATDLTADQRTLLQRMCTTSIPSSTERDSRV